MQVYDRVIIIHIIPMFFPTGFSKELKRTCWSQGFDQKGECYKTKLFDLIKCSHGFNAIVTAMFMTLMIFISAIRKMKLMYLWLRVTHSCNLSIYGKLEINEMRYRISPYILSTQNSILTIGMRIKGRCMPSCKTPTTWHKTQGRV